ncbi:MAG: HAD family hydrolase [Oscillospiraceae bacterium]
MTLYATDLDGTLLRQDMSLSDHSAAVLNRLIDSGVLFTYATARSFSSASPLVSKLKLNCPAVTFNGVFVIDPRTGEHIVENIFTPKSLDIAKEYIVSNSIAPLIYSYVDGRERVSFLSDRLDDVRGYTDSRRNDKRLRPVKNYAELFEGQVFYITILNPVQDTAELFEVFSRENGFSSNIMPDTYDPNTIWFELFSKNASKASAILQVLELTHADKLVCFGDNMNDLSMIRAADTGAAVANACAELKEAADIVIGSNEDDAVAEFIERRESGCGTDRFSEALSSAMIRLRGLHGSVGTQNEKLIHAVLKNYYAPHSDEQEIKIGRYFADAVCEDGIIEIQTRALYRLREKLKDFTAAARVTVVYPVEYETRTIYVNSDTGEIAKETPFRKADPKVRIFKELYSLREYLPNDRVTIILAYLKAEKRVYFSGEALPDLRSRSTRKKITAEKTPLKLLKEVVLSSKEDYRTYLPDGLPEVFGKSEFAKLAKDSGGSLRLEVLREAGLIQRVGKKGNSFLYSVCSEKEIL